MRRSVRSNEVKYARPSSRSKARVIGQRWLGSCGVSFFFDRGGGMYVLPQAELDDGQRQIERRPARESRPQPAGRQRDRAQISEPRMARAKAEKIKQQDAEARQRRDAEPRAPFETGRAPQVERQGFIVVKPFP